MVSLPRFCLCAFIVAATMNCGSSVSNDSDVSREAGDESDHGGAEATFDAAEPDESSKGADGLLDGGTSMDSRVPDGGKQVDHTNMTHVVGEKTFFIDNTEVTNAAYREFLNAGVLISSQPDQCKWNTDFTPASNTTYCSSGLLTLSQRDNYPVVCIDWCDANAYCKWKGKRLCGSGAPMIHMSDWYLACSHNDSKYPYGDNYGPTACNGQDFQQSEDLVPVKAASKCVTASGVYDMSGNAAEWLDICSSSTNSAKDVCVLAGGYFASDSTGLTCADGNTASRDYVHPGYGFRCCD